MRVPDICVWTRVYFWGGWTTFSNTRNFGCYGCECKGHPAEVTGGRLSDAVLVGHRDEYKHEKCHSSANLLYIVPVLK